MAINHNKYHVIVLKGSMPFIWYLSNIGERFTVKELDDDFWIVVDNSKGVRKKTKVILKSDCEIVK